MPPRDPAETSKAASQSGPRALAQNLRNLSHLPGGLALARLGYDLKRPVFALPIYRYSLTGAAPTALAVIPPDPWPGDAARGTDIGQGIFDLAGQRLVNPAPLWAPAGAGAPWLAEMHAFGWLRDLRAAGGDGARRVAREMVGNWLESHGRWSALAWDPSIGGRRLGNWLGAYEFFAASAAVDYRHRLFRAMARQAQHLHRVLPAGLAGAELIAALKGLIVAGACLPGGGAWMRRGLAILERELPRQVLADGGHVERNPARHLAVLRDLIDLRATLHKAELHESGSQRAPGGGPEDGQPGVPAALHETIERMAPALRMFRHGDGGLALFNGACEDEGWRIDMVLQRAGGRQRAIRDAPESGFQLLRAGRATVLVDAGTPPPPGLDSTAHAGTSAFEFSVGRERLIVNCGARADDPTWRRAQRATAAHSTLVLGDTNSSRVLAGPGLNRRAELTRCRREDFEGATWLEVVHDGYGDSFGQIHRRRLYLTADGGDLRGEDRLDPCRRSAQAAPFAIRFHLHPDVQASLSQDAAAAILRLPKGGGWCLRAGGATLGLEPSIYLGRNGEIRRGQQVVLAGHCARHGVKVKWAIKRIDRKRR
jgi:uncharacterized heparinase superfamily protein